MGQRPEMATALSGAVPTTSCGLEPGLRPDRRRHGRSAHPERRRRRDVDHRGGRGPFADDVEGVRVPLAGSYVGPTLAAGAPRLIADISTMPVVGRRAAVVVELTAGYGPAMIVPLGDGTDRGLLVTLRRRGARAVQPPTTWTCSPSSPPGPRSSWSWPAGSSASAGSSCRPTATASPATCTTTSSSGSSPRRSRWTGSAASLQAEHPEAAERLARSVDELDGTMAEIRAAIFELQQGRGRRSRPPCAASSPRSSAGHRGARPARGRPLPRGRWTTCRRELVPDLVAVVRELVTNVVRHAAASRVTVTVGYADEVTVAVADDGGGLPEVTVRSGLANLADRAERRGGRLTTSAGDSGTQVCWAVPAPAADAAVGPIAQPSGPSRSSVARIAAWVRRSSPSLASRWLV